MPCCCPYICSIAANPEIEQRIPHSEHVDAGGSKVLKIAESLNRGPTVILL